MMFSIFQSPLSRRSFIYLTKFRCARGISQTSVNCIRQYDRPAKYVDGSSPNPNVSLSLVCDGADGSNSIILSSWPYSYVFNFGEGFQMTCAAYGKGAKGEKYTHQHMFVTHASWKNVGGILGYVQGSRPARIMHTLHGPAHYKEILNSLKRTTTVFLSEIDGMKLDIMKESRSHFEDGQVRIDYVKLSGEYTITYGQKKEKLAFAYIIKPKRCEMINNSISLDAGKLVELDIQWGPMTYALLRGESITLKNGKTVTPNDVSKKYPRIYDTGSIVVLECPSECYIDSLLSAQEFVDLPTDPEWAPDLIVHMSPANILKDKRYKDFIKRFGKHTTHYVLNENSPGRRCPVYETYRKHLTDWNSDLFPRLGKNKITFSFHKPKPGIMCQGFVGQIYIYRQKMWGIIPPKETGILVPVKKRKSNAERKPVDMNEFPEVVFLGTASSMPQLVRNPTGILVQMRENEYIMLDCGENTLRQMNMLYGTKTPDILRNLKAIFVSHKHYDHLGGVPAVLDEWKKVTEGMDPEPSIYLLCPIEMKEMLFTYNTMLGGIGDRMKTLFHNPLFAWKSSKQTVPNEIVERMEDFKREIGFDEYLAVAVPHHSFYRSYGVVIKHKDGWKLVFTGDTTHKCTNLIELGRDCDILIHDATFPDNREDRAKYTGHSTYKQAIQNGKSMRAKYTILTHFSGIFDGSQYNADKVGVAFDLMKFRPSQGQELSEMDLPCINFDEYNNPAPVLINTQRRVSPFKRVKKDLAQTLKIKSET